jgi:hypothetical protein
MSPGWEHYSPGNSIWHPVPGANVTMAVNDEDVVVGTTNPGRHASLSLPEDAVKLDIRATLGWH